ncbi:hypothetical protein tb265_02190 [Gemmatimonadetes bacterium T265]|nr:hypothetical protein tb265_02190 [Gemmatimonadetes bacterium T265]
MRVCDWSAAPLIRPAAGALAVAALCLVWSVARLARAGTVPDDPAPGDVLAVPHVALPAPTGARGVPLDDDPFSPDRRAPARRYAFPGDVSPADAGAMPAPRPTLLGTAVASDGAGFATARLGDDAPKILHIGDHLGPYTLRAVARGRASFARADGEPFDIGADTPSASR